VNWDDIRLHRQFKESILEKKIKQRFSSFLLFKFISLSKIMLECQLFIRNSRGLVDLDKDEFDDNSNDGFCVPFTYYIMDAILTYRDNFVQEPCLPHLIKHFICHPQLDNILRWDTDVDIMDSPKYYLFLSGHTQLQFNADSDEHKFIQSNDSLKAVSEILKKDFENECLSSKNPWRYFNLSYCQFVIINFRGTRCKKMKNETYSGLKVYEDYYGWYLGGGKKMGNQTYRGWYYPLDLVNGSDKQVEGLIIDFTKEIEKYEL